MEKTRRLKTFSIVALIVAVLGLSIAFAALSKTLTINGTGSVDAANWDIHFKNISEPTLTGKATTTGTPSLADNGATINDMKVSLKEPGDKVVYTVDIENSGDINAEIDSILLPTFTTAQSNILDFKAVYTSNNKEIATGDILESKETKNVTITIMYKDITDESLLPKEGISVNLKYELHFMQTDKASGSSNQGSGSSSYGALVKTWSLSDTIDMTYYGGEEQQDGTYQGGTLVISGTGDMPNYDFEEISPQTLLYLADVSTLEELMSKEDSNGMPIFKYNPTDLILEEGITSIGSCSFLGLRTINNVVTPDTLRKIGSQALSYTGISEIKLDGIEIIGDNAFDSTNLSTTIILPKSVKILGHEILGFYGLEEIYIHSGIQEVHLSSSVRSGGNVYCETEEVAKLVRNSMGSDQQARNIIVDPSRFE